MLIVEIIKIIYTIIIKKKLNINQTQTSKH